VELASLISVLEAAERLGVSPAAVRQQIASQRLPAVKRGPGWWLDTRAVERLARQPLGRGRPLSPEMAWAVLLLASGDAEAAARAAGRDRYRSRADAWLRDHELVEHAARLRARALPEEFEAHPSELPRILKRPDVLCTGISAGGILDLIGGPEAAEGYAPATSRKYIVDEHALDAGAGAVRLRWIRDDLWSLLISRDSRVAPRAAVIIDLLEHDDPRARREAARAGAMSDIDITLRDAPSRQLWAGVGDLVELRRPTLLGAVLIKARSLMVHSNPDTQREDLLQLLALVDDPRAMALDMRKSERMWLQDAEDRLDLSSLSNLDAESMRRATLAYRLLLPTS